MIDIQNSPYDGTLISESRMEYIRRRSRERQFAAAPYQQ
jgi:hypothetical protein